MPRSRGWRIGLPALLACVLSLQALAYSARNAQLFDDRDRAVQLRGLNWFGFETHNHVVHGLWSRNWRELIAQVQSAGFNAVRLPVCPQTLQGVAVPEGSIDYQLNPDLKGLDSLQLLDTLVKGLDAAGLYVVLDHHRPDCQGIAELWYTDGYSEAQWIADLESMARRYRDVPHVVGIDLKNEPHGAATWGTGNHATDFNDAAERAAQAVLVVAPAWLVFVEGVQENPLCSGTDPHFWGENLAPFACTPLRIPADRLVLAPHTYGPDVHPQPYFEAADFPHNLAALRERNFGQFLSQGYAVILGEFGGKYGEGDLRDKVWQDTLVDYLNAKHVRSGFYWALNPNSGDTGGLLRDDWKTWREDKLSLLRRLWSGGAEAGPAAGLLAAATAPLAAAVAAPATATPASVQTVSDWGAGYCVQVKVRNPAASAVRWQAEVAVQGRIDQLWNALQPAPGRFAGVPWNGQLAAGAETEFGFCALRNSAPAPSPVAALADPAAGADAGPFRFSVALESDWGAGYCARVQVRNTGSAPGDWTVSLAIDGRIQQSWKGHFSAPAGQVKVTGEDYNRRLQPGESTDFGFCAARAPAAS